MTDKEYQHALDLMEKGIRADERAKTIELYTEFCKKSHSNFDEEYAEDIRSDFEEWLKEQKNE